MSKKTVKLMQGNEACVEAALMAGMKFFAGYPITPSTELAEISSEKLPRVGGKFIQMEDEIAGIAAAIGGSIAGLKSMTATSGPGFSLKQENIGYAAIAEIPLVIVNVMRGGPSTGLPTSPAQGDVMQAKWGTHGDHAIIALSPQSVMETFDITIKAFNLAEKYRTPVIVLTDEVVGHMREKIEIPEPGDIEIVNRTVPGPGEDYLPYRLEAGDIVPKMAPFGAGYRYHITGLFHDETGFPSNSTENADIMLKRMISKIEDNRDDIVMFDEFMMEDAEYAIISYGSTARTVRNAIKTLREQGMKVGLFRPITIWPSAEKEIREVGRKVKKIIVAEMNMGQYVQEVERIVKSDAEVFHLGRANGEVLMPSEVVQKAKEVF
ncbi:MAG: 2-oxoglutarate ferredoxin oxidoreductase subunit alpha [delta proteobacterium ML8_F1]|nr:MAG: 2-oxoglutarate ferredoxin oxidoreductase subunit alpha [delta proteobacterium ML8_F1]